MQKFVLDVLTRHEIFMDGNSVQVAKELAKTFATLRKRMVATLSTVPGGSATFGSLGAVDTLIESEMREIKRQMMFELTQRIDHERYFQDALLKKVLKDATPYPYDQDELVRAVMSKPVILNGRPYSLERVVDQFIEAQRRQFRTALTTADNPARELSRIIRTRSMQQLKAVTSTTLAHASDSARNEVYLRNLRYIRYEQWVSILDTRTSAFCRSQDGRIYKANDGPRPPAHYNCRSIRVPVLDNRSVNEEYREKAEKRESYKKWFTRQPAEVQQKILGPSRYKLYKQGKLSLDKFVSSAGKNYTLAELRLLEPVAFAKAGL